MSVEVNDPSVAVAAEIRPFSGTLLPKMPQKCKRFGNMTAPEHGITGSAVAQTLECPAAKPGTH
jgi:hypothetical protein